MSRQSAIFLLATFWAASSAQAASQGVVSPLATNQGMATTSNPILGDLTIGGQTSAPGSLMRVDHQLENNTTAPMVTEGRIWPGITYAFAGISKDFNSVNCPSTAVPCVTLFSFVVNNGSPGSTVAIIGDALAKTNGAKVFGSNLIARTGGGGISADLIGLEIDMEPALADTVTDGIGLVLNAFNKPIGAAVQLGALGGGAWVNGYVSSHVKGAHFSTQVGDSTKATSFINTTNGLFSGAAIMLGKGASQAVDFGGGSWGTDTYFFGDTSHNMVINLGSGGTLVIRDPSGTIVHTFDQHGRYSATGGILSSFKIEAPDFVSSGSPPSVSGACAISSQIGGNSAGAFVTASACPSSSFTFTFFVTAPNGYACSATDMTTAANSVRQTSFTTTTATFAINSSANDNFTFRCSAF